MESPIFFSLLIIISAYIPLFTLERVERRLFTPMAFTVCYALLGSMLLALTLIPVLATYLFRNGCKTWENPVLRWLYNAYEGVLRVTVKRACADGGLRRRGGGRRLRAGRAARHRVPAAARRRHHLGARQLARRHLAGQVGRGGRARSAASSRQFPEVQLVSSQSGRNDSGTDPYGPNRNEFFVALKPYDTWPEGMRKADLVDQISAELRAEIPGANFSLTQPIIDNVTEAVTGSPADLAVIISGPDLERLRALADQTLDVLRQIPGAADTFHRAGGRPGAAAHPDRPPGTWRATASTCATCRT